MRVDPPLSDVSLSEGSSSGTPGDGSLRGELPEAPEGWVDPDVRDRLWWLAGTLFRWKWFVIMVALVAGGVAVFLSLQIPNRYRAETRLLLPNTSPAGLGGLIDNLAPGAASLLGGGGGDYTRYNAILDSRTMFEAVVDRFDLQRIYDGLPSDISPREGAVARLRGRTEYSVSLDYDFLAVRVLDEDPERAAMMANAFVELLNQRNIELSTNSAAENRLFMERRLSDAETDLDSVLTEMQAFQERYGIVELESQAEALMGALSAAQVEVARADVLYESLRSLYGEENPEVTAARAAVTAAQSQRDRLTSGSQAVMPVSIAQLPAVGRQYALLRAELESQKAILEVVRPLYEQAALTERQEISAVQVLDPAVPPARKAEPKRSVLVITAAFAAGLLASLLVVLVAWYRQSGRALGKRLRAASA